MSVRAKFGAIAKALNASLIDREEEVSCILVALAAGEHPLFVGPPGSGKSLLCDGLAGTIEGAESFQRLLGKYSEPSELFGPISIKALREDRQEHVIDGFLPTAHIAFVDEIGKASPAIINSLLTVMNERKFDNGPNRIDCPLVMLMGASNEWPVGEGFETCAALFDRFLIRKAVDYVSPTSLSRLIWEELPKAGYCISVEEIEAAQVEIKGVQWSEKGRDALLEIIDRLRREGIRVSDRRVRKSEKIARAVAWLSGSTEVEACHLEILQHVLWEDPVHHPEKAAEVVIRVANPNGMKLTQLAAEAEELMKQIDPRNKSAETYSNLAKLGDVQRSLKELPGPKSIQILQKVTTALNGYNAILMGG